MRHGVRPVQLDLSVVLSPAAAATSCLGRATPTPPPAYDVARTFATLNHLSRGRDAWNVATSVYDAETRNFGLEEHPEHDARHNRAGEFVDVVRRLWESWEDEPA